MLAHLRMVLDLEKQQLYLHLSEPSPEMLTSQFRNEEHPGSRPSLLQRSWCQWHGKGHYGGKKKKIIFASHTPTVVNKVFLIGLFFPLYSPKRVKGGKRWFDKIILHPTTRFYFSLFFYTAHTPWAIKVRKLLLAFLRVQIRCFQTRGLISTLPSTKLLYESSTVMFLHAVQSFYKSIFLRAGSHCWKKKYFYLCCFGMTQKRYKT